MWSTIPPKVKYKHHPPWGQAAGLNYLRGATCSQEEREKELQESGEKASNTKVKPERAVEYPENILQKRPLSEDLRLIDRGDHPKAEFVGQQGGVHKLDARVRRQLQKLYPEQPDEEDVRALVVGIIPKHSDHHHEALPQELRDEPLHDF